MNKPKHMHRQYRKFINVIPITGIVHRRVHCVSLNFLSIYISIGIMARESHLTNNTMNLHRLHDASSFVRYQNNQLFENKEIQSTIKFPTLIPIILSRLSKQMAPVDQTYTCPTLNMYLYNPKKKKPHTHTHTVNTEPYYLKRNQKLFNGLSNSFLIIRIIIIIIIVIIQWMQLAYRIHPHGSFVRFYIWISNIWKDKRNEQKLQSCYIQWTPISYIEISYVIRYENICSIHYRIHPTTT